MAISEAELVAPIRLRLRELLKQSGLSQAKVCERLTQLTGDVWREQRFGKVLNGHIRLRLQDLIWISRASGISLVEIVREPGREFVADLKPTELLILHALREYPDLTKTVLQVIALVREHSAPPKRPSARARHAAMTAKMHAAMRDED